MKNSAFLLLGFILSCTSPTTTHHKTMDSYTFLVGAYTDSAEEGIGLLSFHPDNQSLAHRVIQHSVNNPSFIIQEDRWVFAVEETAGEFGGKVKSFAWNEAKTALTPIDEVWSAGDHPCHLSFQDGLLVVSNYSGGNFSVFRVDKQGALSLIQTVQHQGKSIHEARQQGPHVHSATFSPDGKFLLVADLGTDKIHSYSVNPDAELPIQPFREFTCLPGDGPRHLTFSSDGNEVYVVQELSAVLEVFDYVADTLASKQRLSLTPTDFEGAVGAAEIRIAPEGKHVYVSNRGDANTITCFQKTDAGQFEQLQQVSSGGIMPRNFNLTPDGNFLLVVHQGSGDVVVFERNPESGKLQQLPEKLPLSKPVYLLSLEE